MIKIRNKYIDVDVQKVISLLQNELLKRYNSLYFKSVKVTGRNIMVTCPFHGNHSESHPSMGINVDTGLFNCFTCGEKGSVEDFVSKCFRKDDNGEFGTNWLLSLFSDSVYSDRIGFNIQERKQFVPVKYVSEKELDKYRWYHEYMWKRRLTPEIVELFDIGYDKDTECITFPVNDITGRCVFVARRSVNTKYFNYPKNSKKLLYGLDKCINERVVYVCESCFNALTLWTYGLKAIALLGTGDEYQYDILKKTNIKKFVLALDGDKAGDRGIKRFYENLHDVCLISYIKMPRDGKDINDLTREQFFNLEEISMNF